MSFIEWVREKYVVERSGDKYSLPKLKLNYIRTNSYNSEVIPSSGLAYIEVKFQNKSLHMKKKATLTQLYEKAGQFIEYTNDKGQSELKLSIYQDIHEWWLFWFKDTAYWGLAGYKRHTDTPHWVKNQIKIVLNLSEVRTTCKSETQVFLAEYLSLKRGIKEKSLRENYRRFVNRSLSPIKKFLEAERESLRNSKYTPNCNYNILGFYEEDQTLSKIELEDPPRAFTGDGAHVRPQKRGDVTFNKAVSESYFDNEEIMLVPSKAVLNWPRTGVLERDLNITENKRKKDAINYLETASTIHLQRLMDLLTRARALPEVEPISVVNIKEMFHRDNLESKAQCKAIDIAFGSPDLSLIQGPPGTGKTEVICEIILQIIRKGGRVLLVSPTNIAVDNVLLRIYNEKGVRPIRIGRFEKVSTNLKKIMLQEQVKEYTTILDTLIKDKNQLKGVKALQYDYFGKLRGEKARELKSMILDQSNLVCGTCMGVVSMQFSDASLDKPFDLMIVDEASKATLLEFLVPAVRARNWVLVGDHRQLAPYVSDIELKIYLQGFLEDSGLIERGTKSKEKKNERNREKGTREYSDWVEFHPKVEKIMKYIRRYHEEYHNLETDYSSAYLNRILNVFNFRKKESIDFLNMVEYSLGSSFHFFWKRVDDSRKSYLPYQHRMPDEIASFLNEYIYNYKFKTSTDAANHGYRISLPSSRFTQDIINPTIFVDTSKLFESSENTIKNRKGRIFNILEAKITIELVEIICGQFPLLRIKNGTSEQFTRELPFRIGIITFYVNQARLIRDYLHKVSFLRKKQDENWIFLHNEKPLEVRVSIVDRFQGQEQEIIILSVVRSNKEYNPGFLTNVQRLNVALSRARHNMIIVGDIKFLKAFEKHFRQEVSNPAQLLIDLAQYYSSNNWVTKYKNHSPNRSKIRRRDSA